jgi:predicted phage terminase large subunit-like protein
MKFTEAEKQRLLVLGRKNLMDYCILTNPRYKPNWHHELLAEKLEAVERGEIKRLIVTMPPRHGKTELCSIRFPSWYLGLHPEREIITSSYGADLARDFGGKTREVMDEPSYKSIFPTRLREDARAKDKWVTKEGGSYTAVGIGGAITGRGADVLIIDDPLKNREESESELIRNKVWDWYTSTAYTRLSPNGAVVIIMTRWHLDDLVGRVLEGQELGGEQWEVVDLPAIATTDEEHRKEGEALWVDRYNLEALENIKNTIGIYDWNSLYQCNPVSAETQEFQESWFHIYKKEDLPDDYDVYATVDLAISKSDAADNTSVQVCAKAGNKPEIYHLEEFTGKYDPGQVIDYLFSLKDKYAFKLRSVGIETVAYQKSLVYFINEEMKKKGQFFNIVELKAQGSKETRIRGLIPIFRNNLFFLSEQNDNTKLKDELLHFPFGKHDDRIDSLSYMLQVFRNTVSEDRVYQYKPKYKK